MKLTKLILLLLTAALLFCACTGLKDGTNTESATDTPYTPQSPIGIWYSQKDGYAIEIHSATSVTCYKLKTGYYQYVETESFTCSDFTATGTLQITTKDGATLTLNFDSRQGRLSNADTKNDYSKQEALPTQYIAYAFPDFSSLNCETFVTLNGLDTLTYPEDAYATVAREIFDEFYADQTELPTQTERPAQKGDYVNIDYTGYLDGVAFSGGKAENQMVLIVDESGYIPGFVEGIVGHSVGETFSVPVTFPEDYHSTDMAGKSVIFEMKLNAIYNMKISDESVKSMTQDAYETYDAYVASLVEDSAKEMLWDQILNDATYAELPEVSYLYFYQYYSDIYHEYAAEYSMEYESFLNLMVGVSDAYLLNLAKSIAKNYIVAYAIAKQKSITVSEEDLQAELDRFADELAAENYTPEEIETLLNDDEQKSILKTELLHNAVGEWLLNNCQK